MIPWPFILKHAPAILKAADTLYAHVTTDAGKVKGIEQRVAAMEAQALESARLMREIAEQLQALTLAQQAVADRARLALIVAVAGVVAAVSALLVTLAW